MYACDSPQNSLRSPRTPGSSAWIVRWLVTPGTTSWVPASSGTQNEWITEARSRRRQASADPGWHAFGAGRSGVAGELRAVAEPGRAERQVPGGPWGCGLVRREDLLLRVVELPPPLVAEHVHLEHVALGLGGEVPDRGDRGHGHAGEDERRQDRPRDLQARVAVHLRGIRSRPFRCRYRIANRTRKPSTRKKITAATQKTGTNRSCAFCAYGPAGSSADCEAFGAQAAPITARAERPRIVLLRTFPVSLRTVKSRAPRPGAL